MSKLENRIPPPLVMLVFALAMWFASYRLASIAMASQLSGFIIVIAVLIGLLYLGLGVSTFRKAKTTIDPVRIERASSLVTTGIFQYTRNPMYVGFTCLLIGLAIFLASPWLLIGPALFVLYINNFQIAPEERIMQAKFGNAFEDYKKHVRRWI